MKCNVNKCKIRCTNCQRTPLIYHMFKIERNKYNQFKKIKLLLLHATVATVQILL